MASDDLLDTSANDPVGQASADGGETSVAQPPLVKLSSLVEVPVTSVWPTEPHHFTPWLLENAELLSGVLGLDIELDSREYRVGKFSLDLIGREVATGDPVIIENQFGPTDHIHLGQILTYAGGTKPSTIIWVAEHFREEHRAALEWLNAHTEPGIRFFGIKVTAVTIKGAPTGLIAPSLELVAKPNDWEKQAAATAAAAAGSSPTAQLYSKFWATFAPLAQQRGWTSAAGTNQNWWSMSAKTPNAAWVVSYAQFGCRSELFFNHPDPSVNLARWSQLQEHEAQIKSAFGSGDLLFDELPNNKGTRIEARLLGPKIGNEAAWPSVLAWMIDTQERLRAAVQSVGGVPNMPPPGEADAPG